MKYYQVSLRLLGMYFYCFLIFFFNVNCSYSLLTETYFKCKSTYTLFLNNKIPA